MSNAVPDQQTSLSLSLPLARAALSAVSECLCCTSRPPSHDAPAWVIFFSTALHESVFWAGVALAWMLVSSPLARESGVARRPVAAAGPVSVFLLRVSGLGVCLRKTLLPAYVWGRSSFVGDSPDGMKTPFDLGRTGVVSVDAGVDGVRGSAVTSESEGDESSELCGDACDAPGRDCMAVTNSLDPMSESERSIRSRLPMMDLRFDGVAAKLWVAGEESLAEPALLVAVGLTKSPVFDRELATTGGRSLGLGL